MSLQIETAQNVGVDYEVASVGDRILAQFIDYAIYFVWLLAVIAVVGIANSAGRGLGSTWIMTGAIILPVLLYPLLCEYFLNGQTVGKMALKIRVIKLDGSKATLSAYLLRWLLSIVDIGFFSGMIAVLTIAINGKGQRVGDIAAGTTVVKTQPSVRLAQLLHSGLAPDYKPSYSSVTQLSDKDISTLRKVIASGNPELLQAAVHKIEELIGVNNLDEPQEFLKTIVSDYQYYVAASDM
ncbi:RDD family protein [Dyadobacter sp. 32]|uniref:RDD family protein n=1 Tax=Dyadobacter sp. 32 TaxID=538966 RepID=UPI0011ED5873